MLCTHDSFLFSFLLASHTAMQQQSMFIMVLGYGRKSPGYRGGEAGQLAGRCSKEGGVSCGVVLGGSSWVVSTWEWFLVSVCERL